MLQHIVMFQLKERTQKNIDQICNALNALPAKISEIQTFEVGVDENRGDRSMDIVLVSSFKSKEDLQTYQVHPDHVTVVKLIQELCIESRVVDYIN